MKATIDTITVTVGAQKLTFTMEEAKALMDVLNEKLGVKQVSFPTIIEKHYPAPRIRDTWVAPMPWDETKIVCGTGANAAWNAGERLDSTIEDRAVLVRWPNG